MTKKYELTPQELAFIWVLGRKLISFFHQKRSHQEFEAFQKENFDNFHHFYYELMTSKIDDNVIEKISEADVEDVPFEQEVRNLSKILL